jgi:ADP-heptose:LPS heptosyltransferase
MSKFLVIQTAFIGDVILATVVLEKLHQAYPNDRIDLLVRKGSDALFKQHPYVNKVYAWDKKTRKYKNLISLIKVIRNVQYDYVINLQRFFSTGLATVFSKARFRIGFCNNPLSFLYHFKTPYLLDRGLHEVDRNAKLVETLTDSETIRPRLYPSIFDSEKTILFKQRPYICLAPASIWPTKRLPKKKWVELARYLYQDFALYFIGSKDDRDLCAQIMTQLPLHSAQNLCGELSLLQSATLMQDAHMNYVNDSAPLHLASSVDAPTTAFFCSTVTDFGFGPLAKNATVAQIESDLYCRPCGVHGRRKCPEDHFRCGHAIDVKKYLP